MQERPEAPTNQIMALVREFVRREVAPQAAIHDRDDTYPHELVGQMTELGLFGIAVPEEYGGLGLNHTTFAMIFEELSKGWMSITGVLGTHSILTYTLARFGTPEQKRPMAAPPGQWRDAGSAGDDGAQCRQRRCRHPDRRRSRGRRVRCQWAKAFHHQWEELPRRASNGEDRPVRSAIS